MKKLLIATCLLALSGVASAAPQTFVITGGQWIEQFIGGANALTTGEAGLTDNGEAQAAALGNSGPPFFNPVSIPWYLAGTGTVWDPTLPANAMDGVYSGSIDYDDGTGVVTGGTLSVTGKIGGGQIVVPDFTPGSPTFGLFTSWWAHEYTNLTIDLGAGTATSTSYQCYETYEGPAPCAAAQLPTANAFAADGAITFDGANLVIQGQHLAEGFDPDTMMPTFTLEDRSNTFSVVPIPAAVWLFGSALGLMGFIRRRKA